MRMFSKLKLEISNHLVLEGVGWVRIRLVIL